MVDRLIDPLAEATPDKADHRLEQLVNAPGEDHVITLQDLFAADADEPGPGQMTASMLRGVAFPPGEKPVRSPVCRTASTLRITLCWPRESQCCVLTPVGTFQDHSKISEG